MPFDLQSPPAEAIKLLATYITFVTKSNEQKATAAGLKPTRFHARTLPSIDILGYLNRILKYAPCGTECFLAMIIYLERISVTGTLIFQPPTSEDASVESLQVQLQNTSLSKESVKGIVVDAYNIHRLLITAALVSIKFLSDVFYTNLHVSRVGGVPVSELNQMELEFLKLCDFSLLITPAELVECGDSLLTFSLKYRAGQSYDLPPLLSGSHIEFRNDSKPSNHELESPPTPSPLTISGKENILSHSSSSEIYQLDNTTHTTALSLFYESSFDMFPTPQNFELFEFSSTLTAAVARRVRFRNGNLNLKLKSVTKSRNTTTQRRYRRQVYGGKRKEWKSICDGPFGRNCSKCKKNLCRCKKR